MRRIGLPGLILLLFVLLLVVPSAVGYYTDWLWFRELGYEGVFLRTLNAQRLVFAATFVVVFLVSVRSISASRGATLTRPQIVLGTGVDGRRSRSKAAGLRASRVWGSAAVAGSSPFRRPTTGSTWLSFFNGAPFGDTDPLFGRDVAFYVFRLPVWQMHPARSARHDGPRAASAAGCTTSCRAAS